MEPSNKSKKTDMARAFNVTEFWNTNMESPCRISQEGQNATWTIVFSTVDKHSNHYVICQSSAIVTWIYQSSYKMQYCVFHHSDSYKSFIKLIKHSYSRIYEC